MAWKAFNKLDNDWNFMALSTIVRLSLTGPLGEGLGGSSHSHSAVKLELMLSEGLHGIYELKVNIMVFKLYI